MYSGLSQKLLGLPILDEDKDIIQPSRLEFGLKYSPSSELSSPDGLVFCTLCTENYLAAAVLCCESFARYHPSAKVVLMIVDGNARPGSLPADWKVIFPRQVGVPNFGWLAAKYNATDLCCAMKPFLLLEAARIGARVVFADADIEIFSEFTELLELLAGAPFVVIPHLRSPLPRPERFWERPTIGDLAYSGVMNAGLFGANFGNGADAFARTWCEIVTQPGAFLNELGPQMEQNSFNWITAFEPRTRVLGETRYNVSYWNLDDRSLRWCGLDDGDPEHWTVDGKPLAAFHFSGVRLEDLSRVSVHDFRHSIMTLPSVVQLYRRYVARIQDLETQLSHRRDYAFDTLPNGQKMKPEIRLLLKRYERSLPVATLDPWAKRGAAAFCRLLMKPLPATGSLLPFAFAEVYRARSDLKEFKPNADLRPDDLSGWIAHHGIAEYDLAIAFSIGRQSLPTTQLADIMASELLEELPEGCDLGLGRPKLIAFLSSRGHAALAKGISEAAHEVSFATPLHAVRQMYERSPGVREAFPDPFGLDFDAFSRWLDLSRAEEMLRIEHIDSFKTRRADIAVARLSSYLGRRNDLMEKYPRALIGESLGDLLRALLSVAQEGLEFDADDIIAAEWTLSSFPGRGLKFLLESPFLRAKLATRTRGIAKDVNAGVLDPETFEREFTLYSSCFTKAEIELDRISRDWISETAPWAKATFFDVIREVKKADMLERGYPALRRELLRSHEVSDTDPFAAPRQRGVNLFGYFCSNIGLGLSSQGLSQAIRAARIGTAQHVLGNVDMAALTDWRQLLHHYQFNFDTNVFVSYPHHERYLKSEFPAYVFSGRRNVVHLAWEQRDWSELWRNMYDFADQIWAISDFAAAPLRRLFGDRVHVVPNVLAFESFPGKCGKAEVGLSEDEHTFLYVFDANSSVERKNPDAAVRAFGRAFGGPRRRTDVRLILKIGHFTRPEHERRMRRLMNLCSAQNLPISILPHEMSYDRLLQLVSAADCYVSPHRSEGFGFTCAEAMSYGVPVIATGYSGNLEFMNEENSLLIRTDEITVTEGEGPFQRGSVWGDPDIDHAAELMRAVVESPEKAKTIGERGRRDVREKLSPECVGRRIATFLQ